MCLGLPLGLRAGAEALSALAVPRSADKDLTAIVEVVPEQFFHCFGDGIQWITGCTLGKNNLQLQPLGKFAVTVIEMNSQEGVRISFRAEFLEDFLQWSAVADKAHPQPGYLPRPGEVSMRIQKILERPLSELFSPRHFVGYSVSAPVMDWTHVRCTGCGELVIGRYAHHLGKEAWCPFGWGHRVHGPGPDEGR